MNDWGKREFCSHGHPFTPENTYYPPRGKWSVRICRTCTRIALAKYARKYPERAALKESKRRMRAKERYKRLIFDNLGNICACCGEWREELLTLDHINGDGAAHRKVRKNSQVYLDVINAGYPKDKYRLLCMNCNWARRFTGSCPHEVEHALMQEECMGV